MEALVLFDIDGTLVRPSFAHDLSFTEAMKQLFNVDASIYEVNYSGSTDLLIFRDLCELKGIGNWELREQDFIEIAIDAFNRFIKKDPVKPLGGVRDLLETLQANNLMLGLVTGNIESIAFEKLKSAGLDGLFKFGGFGSDNPVRSEMVKIAISRARKLGFEGGKIFLVGDTPRDILAGRQANVTTIGVASGDWSVEQLKEAGAQFVLKGLCEKAKFLSILEE